MNTEGQASFQNTSSHLRVKYCGMRLFLERREQISTPARQGTDQAKVTSPPVFSMVKHEFPGAAGQLKDICRAESPPLPGLPVTCRHLHRLEGSPLQQPLLLIYPWGKERPASMTDVRNSRNSFKSCSPLES